MIHIEPEDVIRQQLADELQAAEKQASDGSSAGHKSTIQPQKMIDELSDHEICKRVRTAIEDHEGDDIKGFIIEGFPSNVAQFVDFSRVSPVSDVMNEREVSDGSS